MKRPNIIILVIDTLREDYSQGLSELEELGFVKYENAIAPAPWTLPSHVSLITGLYPSQHGVHEAYGIYVDKGLPEISSTRLNALNHGLIGELMNEGYSTYIVSANPFLSPLYGFDKYTENLITGYSHLYAPKNYDEFIKYNQLNLMAQEYGKLKAALMLINNKKLLIIDGMKYYLLSRLAKVATKLNLYDPTFEKGSHIIEDFITKRKFNEPFLLLINVMEAHGPYTPRDIDEKLSFNAYFNAVFKGYMDPHVVEIWRNSYPRHASYAVKRAIAIIHGLRQYFDNSLIIVTADHGELLGDGGIHHGYFLRDGLLRVPLWIRWPSHVKKPRQIGHYVSLTQIPGIINSVINGDEVRVGSDLVMSESFGSTLPSRYEVIYKSLPHELLGRVFSYRIRVYTKIGVATYNVNFEELEDIVGNEDVKRIIKELVKNMSS